MSALKHFNLFYFYLFFCPAINTYNFSLKFLGTFIKTVLPVRKQVSITGKCDACQTCTFKMPSGMSKFHFKTKQMAITFPEVKGKAKAFPTQLKLNKTQIYNRCRQFL